MKIYQRAIYVLFMPGLYGSTLIEKTSGQLEWLTAKNAIIGGSSWAVPTPGMEYAKAKDLVPGGVLEDVPILGTFYSVDVYGPTLKKVKEICEKKKCEVVPVYYDWRKEPLSGAITLENKIKEIKKPGDKVYLFAHSYGAFITSYFLRYGVQPYDKAVENWDGLKQLDGAILAAAPYHGGNTLFRNVVQGAKLNGRWTLVDQIDYPTFEAAYFLMPPPNEMAIYSSDLKKVKVETDQVDFWEKNSLGFFSSGNAEYVKDKNLVRNHLRDVLKRASVFYEKQIAPIVKIPANNPKIVFVTTTGTPTIDRGIWKKNEGQPDVFVFNPPDIRRHFSKVKSDWSKIDGDGSISAHSQKVPPALAKIAAKTISLPEKHLEVLISEAMLKELNDLF